MDSDPASTASTASTGRRRWSRAALRLVGGAAVLACAAPALAAPASAATPTAGGVLTRAIPSLWGDDTTGQSRKASASGAWSAQQDLGSMWSTAGLVGARSAWAGGLGSGAPATGKGVTVALIDTGVTPVQGLDGAGKVVNGPDLSFDGQARGTRYLDGNGHGTFMAGIIAGRDGASGAPRDASSFSGVAPDAQLLNVKVGAADGGADVTQVIAAVDWVVQHRHDHGMDVRVINLSYGTDTTGSYAADPLARAVEDAWRAGIVVVAAAGNDGTGALTMPAADPYTIAVGASDHVGTASATDDRVTDFTNPGTRSRQVDVLAPGKSVVSLRVPGSVVDTEHPEGLVTGDASGRFFRGSGTSEAAAVVSGSVALLLEERPSLTPDQVKQALTTSSSWVASQGLPLQGAGRVDADRAASLLPALLTRKQTWARSTGTAPLDDARGTSRVVDPEGGAVLAGQVDALGAPWDGAAMAAASAAGTAWSGGAFNGRAWAGSGWQGDSWAPVAWTGSSWTGQDWSSRRWSSDTWTSRRWSGEDWSSRRWSGDSWSGSRWSGSRWS